MKLKALSKFLVKGKKERQNPVRMRQNAMKKPPKQDSERNLMDKVLFFRHHIKRDLRAEKVEPD